MVVAVEIPAAVAGLGSCQHTAWMLLNLLARQERIVGSIYLSCPGDVPLAGRVVPLAARDVDLRTALLDGVRAVGAVLAVPGRPPEAAFRFIIGPGSSPENAYRVHGERWWGGITSGALNGTDANSTLPFGPYAAACIAAAQVYLGVRLTRPTPATDAFYSTWSLCAFSRRPTEREDIGPGSVASVELDAVLAGAGAVGNTWVHAIWATVGITGSVVVADADELGVDRTNLNRCPALGVASTGKQKATEVAANCGDSQVTFLPFNGRVEDCGAQPTLLISAVDTNGARRAVQTLYPARLLGASTHDLRCELVRTDPTSAAACVSCHNPPEADIPDAELRRKYLLASEDEKQQFAHELGHTRAEAEAWATAGQCSNATDRLIQHLRATNAGPAAFSVGFVSVLAGTMLAGQTIREVTGDRCLDGVRCRATVTFWDPAAPTNVTSFYQRDRQCPVCDPTRPAHEIWVKRYLSFPDA